MNRKVPHRRAPGLEKHPESPFDALVALLAVVLAGCSISASSVSSWSLSKSSRSSSRSSDSSSSSSPGAAEEAYREDVSDYTRAYVKSGGDFRAFQSDLAKIAQEHGITNWEENPLTYRAIGEGLGSAKVSDAELMAYKRNLSRGDPTKAEEIEEGYRSTH
jgi:hypothetical protein